MLRTGAAIPHRFSTASRLTASLAYLGVGSAVILALDPRRRFVRRHALLALGLHAVRFVWCAVALIIWALQGGQGADLGQLGLNLGGLLLIGLPWFPGIEQTLALALALPLGFTWILGVAGASLAATGRTADLVALVSADWSDPIPSAGRRTDTQPLSGTSLLTGDPTTWPVVDDRLRARTLTEQRLSQIWNASRVAASERRRSERMDQVRGDLDLVLGQLSNLNQMLSLGEISLSRFKTVHAELIGYLSSLRLELSDLEARRIDLHTLTQHVARPPTLDNLPEVRVMTLAIVDRSGIPIQTYGYFPLDESLITGMVSAFESLTAEMFGSQVHKTQLSDGQVVYFARGKASVTFAIFEDEPSPAQIATLREFVDGFERANGAVLDQLPIDIQSLLPVEVPFTLAPPPTPAAAPAGEPVPTIPLARRNPGA